MRISVRKTDPGYRPDAIRFMVKLNGELLADCFTADEEQGKAWVFDRNEVGDFIITGVGKGRRLVEKEITGEVRIIGPETAPPILYQ